MTYGDLFIDIKEAARIVGMSPQWLYPRLQVGGGPPHFKRGKSYRFRRDEVEQWALERKLT